jgi:hypothetical protein
MEGSVRCLIELLSRILTGGTEKTIKNSLRIVGVSAEIRTENPQKNNCSSSATSA